jgi:hypothetical protein
VGGCLKVENKVLEGPKNDFGGFLTAVDQLHTNVEYLTMNRSFKASDGALNHARELLAKGMTRLEEEFRVLLTQHRFDSLPLACYHLPLSLSHFAETTTLCVEKVAAPEPTFVVAL